MHSNQQQIKAFQFQPSWIWELNKQINFEITTITPICIYDGNMPTSPHTRPTNRIYSNRNVLSSYFDVSIINIIIIHPSIHLCSTRRNTVAAMSKLFQWTSRMMRKSRVYCIYWEQFPKWFAQKSTMKSSLFPTWR